MAARTARGLAAAVVAALVCSLTVASTAGADEPVPSEPAPGPTPTATSTAPDPAAPAATPTVALDSTTYTGLLARPLALTGTVTALPSDAGLVLEVQDGPTWTPADAPVTVDGTTFATSLVLERSTTVRVVARGSDGTVLATSERATVTAERIPTSLTWSMPATGKDYAKARVTVQWSASVGPAPSGPVSLRFRSSGSKDYRHVVTVQVRDGRGEATIAPRNHGRFVAVAPDTAVHRGVTGATRAFSLRPPGTAVKLPKGAAKPKIKLAAQPRHTRAAADASSSAIPDSVWKNMKGRSWHSGCPVGRGSLRLVKVSYWGFDGYVRRGEIVVHERAAARTKAIFTDLFEKRTPIRSMYRVDRFGWSKKLKGADDYKSMRADNTSGFNCRQIVGRTGQRSPHAWGRSIDINPWENPYRSGTGWTPNASWHKRSKPTSITWRGSNDPVVKVFRKHGFRWLDKADLHHFED